MTVKNAKTPNGWVFYDAHCAFCKGCAGRAERLLGRRGFTIAPLQSLSAPDSDEMRVQLPNGRIFGGADAIITLARRVWWAWPLWLAAQIPGVMPLLRTGYRFIARRRHCIGGACEIRRRTTWIDWLPLVVFPTLALGVRNVLPDWQFMWLLAFAIFLGCKWLTWRRVRTTGQPPGSERTLGYLFAWPGMDAKEFLNDKSARPPKIREWLFALGKTFFGAILLRLATTNVFASTPMLNGWLTMFSVVLLLHFGLFHLLALFWQSCGVAAKPLMRAPLLATSLAEFWGARWNTAFNNLAHDFTFRPIARRFGTAWATLAAFFVSGLIHDLVISLPAHGGYGLPTAYFILQGSAVLFERSVAGRKLGLGRGGRGWLFMFVITAAPAYWLFHRVFIHNVILPMTEAVGTIWNTP